MSGHGRSKQSKLPWVAIYFDKKFIGLRQLFKGKNSTRPGHGNERALRIGFDECETAEVPMTCRTNMNNKMVVHRDVVKADDGKYHGSFAGTGCADACIG